MKLEMVGKFLSISLLAMWPYSWLSHLNGEHQLCEKLAICDLMLSMLRVIINLVFKGRRIIRMDALDKKRVKSKTIDDNKLEV